MKGSFEESRKQALPAFLDDEVGQGFEGVRGAAQDVEVRLLEDGRRARMLDFAPDDALDHLARQAVLPRVRDEPDALLRARLRDPWATWADGGLRRGVISQIGTLSFNSDESGLSLVDTRVYEDLNGLDAALDWEWCAAPGEWYSRFWVVIGPRMPWLPMVTPFVTTDDGDDGTTTLGSTATRAEVLAMKREILKWKSPHGYPVAVILSFEGTPLQGDDLTTPFETGEVPCVWWMGKLFGVTLNATPFTTGDYLM
jgi:hypothetical protein